jgi:hypothetical protein
MYYLVIEDMFRPMLLRHLQVGWKQRNVFRNETYLYYKRFKDCSDWSHVIPLTAFSFPHAHNEIACQLRRNCVA